jgi:hypothetical protein
LRARAPNFQSAKKKSEHKQPPQDEPFRSSGHQMLSQILFLAVLIYLAIRLLALIILILRHFHRHHNAGQRTLSPHAMPTTRLNANKAILRVTLPDECL